MNTFDYEKASRPMACWFWASAVAFGLAILVLIV